jgi:hypothetical protein
MNRSVPINIEKCCISDVFIFPSKLFFDPSGSGTL